MTLGSISNGLHGSSKLHLLNLSDSDDLHQRPDTRLAKAPGGEGANMSLVYPAGGALGALGVVGLCQSTHERFCLHFADLKSRYAVQWRRREFQRTSTRSMQLLSLARYSRLPRSAGS